jgi:hypothetical protein
MNERPIPDRIVDLFTENELDISTLTTYPINSNDKTKLNYVCICGNPVENSWRTFVRNKKFFCKECVPNKKTGKKAPSIEEFIEMLDNEDYSLVHPENSGYIDTKTLVLIRDPLGNVYKGTYTRFEQGHRSKAMVDLAKKLPPEEVKKRIEKAGFEWIPGSVYVNEKIKILVKCHCGNISGIAVNNMRKKRVGCEQCYMYNRKYNWDYVEGIAEKYNCTIITLGKFYRGKDTIIEIICACGEEMIKNVRGFLTAPRCKSCSKISRQITNVEKYGHKNYLASEMGKEAITNHWKSKFGVTHNMQLEKTKQKARETCLKNHGVECVLVTEEVRKKAIEVHIEKYGFSPGNCPEIREKMKKTNKERYGADFPLSSKIVQKTIKKNNYEKYGNEVFLQSDAGKKLMVEKYGVENCMQCPEIFEKAQRAAFKLKRYKFPSGKIKELQGYEWKCMVYLLYVKNIPEDNIIVGAINMPKVLYTIPGETKQRRYFMDAHLPVKNKGIEVKSTWTYTRHAAQDKAKWIAASFVCKGGFYIYVYDKDGLAFRQCIKNGKIVKDRATENYFKSHNLFEFPI